MPFLKQILFSSDHVSEMKTNYSRPRSLYLLLALLVSFSTLIYSKQSYALKKQETYQCPMLCEGNKVYGKPQKCPVCGMDIKKVVSRDSKLVNKDIAISGAMMNVMHKGELWGTINLDTIADKKHLYGIGPLEYLTGEILIIDGRCYKSEVVTDTRMKVSETFQLKAPFFGYTHVAAWKDLVLPDSIIELSQLEHFLNAATENYPRPFFFKILAQVEQANIHVVHLQAGSKVSSPQEAHQGQKNYEVRDEEVEMIGFFSTEHQAILTHHDSWVHIHLITQDRTQMGHLESVKLKKGSAKLFLPAR